MAGDSDNDYGNPSPTPWGYWAGGGDAGAYWVEEAPPANAGYTPVTTGGGDAGTTTTWEPVAPTPSAPAPDYGGWGAPTTGPMAVDPGDNSAEINALYRELLGRDADPTGLSVNRGMSAATIRQAIMESPEYRARVGGGGAAGGGGTGATPYVPVTPVQPGTSSTGIARNPMATLDISPTASSVWQPASPYYQTTSPVQSQYSWAPRSQATPLQGGIPNWGIQQPTRAFDVNQFITDMLGPKAQAQTTTLPTPYPGR